MIAKITAVCLLPLLKICFYTVWAEFDAMAHRVDALANNDPLASGPMTTVNYVVSRRIYMSKYM